MKIISAAVQQLTPEELAQAAYLYHKNWVAQRNKTIPKPHMGTVRKDGTPKRFVYQSTRQESAGETHIYLDTLENKKFEITYTKDPVTGCVTQNKKLVN